MNGGNFWDRHNDRSSYPLTKCPLLLNAFRRIAKSDYQLRLFCTSVPSYGTTRLPLDGFSWYLIFDFPKSVEKIQVPLKSDKNYGTLHGDQCTLTCLKFRGILCVLYEVRSLLTGAVHCNGNCNRPRRFQVMKRITTNKMAAFLNLFISTDALHVSGGSSAHHQEHITVHTASGIVNRYCC